MDAGVDWNRTHPFHLQVMCLNTARGRGDGELLPLGSCLGVKWSEIVMWDLALGPWFQCRVRLPNLHCLALMGVQPQLSYQMWFQGTPLLIRECPLIPGIPWMSGWHPALQEPMRNDAALVGLFTYTVPDPFKCNLQWGWEKPAVPQSEPWLCFH